MFARPVITSQFLTCLTINSAKMMRSSVLVLALLVLGASDAFGFVTNGFGGLGYGTLGGRVSDVCRCTKTVVRPQIRTEIASVPTLQHFVRTEATPVIERIPYSVARRVDSPGFLNGGAGILSGGFGSSRGFGGVGVLSGVSALNNGCVY